MSADWFSGLPAARAEIDCGSATHTIAWSAGRLNLDAHPEAQLDAERALAGLSGQPCRCIQLFDLWRAHAADPMVLVLGPRDAADVVANPALPRRGLTGANGLEAVLSLEGAIPHRLVATVAAALSDRTDDPALEPILHAALYGRLLASISRWTDHTPELELQMSDDTPALARNPDGSLTARLAFDWITAVWAHRRDVVDGQFTLAARRDPSGSIELLTVDHALTPHTRTVTP